MKSQMQSTPLAIISAGYLDCTLPDDSSENGSQTPCVIHVAKKISTGFLSVWMFHVITVSADSIPWSNYMGQKFQLDQPRCHIVVLVNRVVSNENVRVLLAKIVVVKEVYSEYL